MYNSNIENHNYPYSHASVNDLKELGLSNFRSILERRGHLFNSSGNTNCIDPSHEDRNPSMSATNGEGCYCHSCGFKAKDPIKLVQQLDNLSSYKDAIESLARELDFNLISNQSYHKKSNKSINKGSRKPLQDIEIATQPIPDNIPEKGFEGQDQYQTIYPYSQSQWVIRTESENGKKFLHYHRDEKGNDVCKKGSDQWFPYCIEDVAGHALDKYPLLLEGEKCVEAARSLGLVTTTFVGSGWSGEELEQNLEALKDLGIPGLVFWPDNDKPGFDKAHKVREIGDRIELKIIVIDPLSIWQQMPEKGDIVDFLEAHQISGAGMINRLKLAEELQPQETETITPEPEQELPPRDRLMLDLQAYLLEKDNPSKALIFAQICRKYSLPKYAVESLLLDLDTGSQSRKIRKFKGTQFLNSDVHPVQFLVQGVPVGGVTVLAGAQGKGKTTNAYWLAKCVLDGETYLDDTPSATGGVLIINSDEGLGSSLDRIIDMDFPDDDRWSFWGNFNIDRHFEELEAEVQQTRPKLIIVDSFCGIHGEGFDENSSLAGLTINKLNKLAEAYNCAIIVIHHFNKDEKLRGSSRIGDIAHSILTISENKDGTRQYKSLKIRGASPFEISLKLNNEGIPVICQGGSTIAQKSNQTDILQCLIEAQTPLEPTEIVELTGLSKQQVWDGLKRLKNAGKALSRRSDRDKRAKQWYTNCHSTVTTPLTPSKNNSLASNFEPTYTQQAIQPEKNTSCNTCDIASNSSEASNSVSENTSASNGASKLASNFYSLEAPSDKGCSENTSVASKFSGSEGSNFKIGSKLRHREFPDLIVTLEELGTDEDGNAYAMFVENDQEPEYISQEWLSKYWQPVPQKTDLV